MNVEPLSHHWATVAATTCGRRRAIEVGLISRRRTPATPTCELFDISASLTLCCELLKIGRDRPTIHWTGQEKQQAKIRET